MQYLYFINTVYRYTLCFYPHTGLLKQIADQVAMIYNKKERIKTRVRPRVHQEENMIVVYGVDFL